MPQEMTRERLIASARAKGYTGKAATVADLKTWFTEAGINPDKFTSKGVEYKIDEVWAKEATLDLPDDDGETEPEVKPETKAAPVAPRQSGNGWGKGPGRTDGKALIQTGESFLRRAEKSAYKRRIAAGKAAFDDADTAERAGAFFRLAMCKHLEGFENYAQKAMDLEIIGKDMAEGVNSTGGALVPDEFLPTLIWLTEKYGVARKLARIQKMNRDHMTIPRRISIVTMAALGEAQAITATNNTYDNIELTAKKWGLLIKSSSELVEDSAINIADEITNTVAEAQAYAEDDAYFNGDGSATYNGIEGLTVALPSGAYVAQATSNTWAAQTEPDILNMPGRVQNVKWENVVGVSSRQWFWQVAMRLAQAKSGNNVNTMLLGPERGPNGEDAILYGFPWYFSQVLPTATATTGRMAYFGDFKTASVIGDRRDVRIDFSDQRFFDTDQVAWRATSRFTVNIHGDGRGTTYGPITALKTG